MAATTRSRGVAACVALAASAVLGCGSGDHAALLDEPALLVDERTPERFAGRFTAAEGAVELSSAASVQPFAGNVSIDTGSLVYAVHYDYAARRVVTDGGGRAIDRESQRLLGEGLEHVTALLGPNNPELPLHEQMLYASLAMLQESAGMPLERTTFEIEPSDVEESNVDPGGVGPGSVEKSLGNDGVSCVKRQQTYSASYDYGGTVIVDYAITADASECNGRCGPTCTQLTPWNMWTLDCLEHDACCDATSDDSCWTPLGECGDEYGEAQTDFLRGFDPFRKHCGG